MCILISRVSSTPTPRTCGCECAPLDRHDDPMIVPTRKIFARLLGAVRSDELRARLVRGALGSAGVQAASRILALVLGVILARALGPEGYGTYAYAFAIMSLLMVAAEAGVPTLLMREVAAAEGRGNWGLMRGALQRGFQLVAVVSVVIAAAGLIVLTLLADRMAPTSLNTMALMLLLLPVATMAKTVGHALWGLHRVVTAQIVLSIISPALFITFISGVFFLWPEMRKPAGAMAAQLAAALASLMIAAVLLKRALPAATQCAAPKFYSRKWVRSALPFILIGGAGFINTQTDIIMLGWLAEPEEVGIYRVAVQGAMLVPGMTLHIANAVLASHFARLYAQGDMALLQRTVKTATRAILLAAISLVILLVLAGEPAIVWLFGVEFAPAYRPFLILMVTQLAVISFGQVDFLLNMTGHERIVNRVLWQTACLNVFFNAALIPYFSGIGAAVATSASLLLRAIILRSQVKKKLGLSTSVLGRKRIGIEY